MAMGIGDGDGDGDGDGVSTGTIVVSLLWRGSVAIHGKREVKIVVHRVGRYGMLVFTCKSISISIP